jgi:hypothetical protein
MARTKTTARKCTGGTPVTIKSLQEKIDDLWGTIEKQAVFVEKAREQRDTYKAGMLKYKASMMKYKKALRAIQKRAAAALNDDAENAEDN